jgi:hypothetical protein
MTSSLQSSVGDDIVDISVTQDLDICVSCPHPRAVHDVTGLRFCAATERMTANRRCVCRDDVVTTEQRTASAHRFGYSPTRTPAK